MEKTYLVWSHEHGAWWRPERRGYTTDLDAAGRYSRGEAIKICALSRDGWRGAGVPSEIPVAEADAFACKDVFYEMAKAICGVGE